MNFILAFHGVLSYKQIRDTRDALNLEDYLNRLSENKRLSEVKKKIIAELWDSDKVPMKWVSSERLLAITGQKYFDRRARELRDENGADIESANSSGSHVWRLRSLEIASGNSRAYLSAQEKQNLFLRQEHKCQICGKQTAPGVRGLQADHKVPLIRGGRNVHENWQSICNECNVAKRRMCQGCEDSCSECVWAYPENTGMLVCIPVPTELVKKLRDFALHHKEHLWKELSRILK